MSRLLRGQVVLAHIGLADPKPMLVVSNNRRNAALDTVLAVRMTTTAKRSVPSIVEADEADPFTGRILCDEIVEVFDDEVVKDWGSATPRTMRAVEEGLRHALGL